MRASRSPVAQCGHSRQGQQRLLCFHLPVSKWLIAKNKVTSWGILYFSSQNLRSSFYVSWLFFFWSQISKSPYMLYVQKLVHNVTYALQFHHLVCSRVLYQVKYSLSHYMEWDLWWVRLFETFAVRCRASDTATLIQTTYLKHGDAVPVYAECG